MIQLFHTSYLNNNVHEHNERMLSLMKKEENILNSYDITVDSTNINHNKQIKLQFPSSIVLKENMLVELIGRNYNIQDGLVNGVEGIFRGSTTFENGAIWIEFIDPFVGTTQCGNKTSLQRWNNFYVDTRYYSL